MMQEVNHRKWFLAQINLNELNLPTAQRSRFSYTDPRYNSEKLAMITQNEVARRVIM